MKTRLLTKLLPILLALLFCVGGRTQCRLVKKKTNKRNCFSQHELNSSFYLFLKVSELVLAKKSRS